MAEHVAFLRGINIAGRRVGMSDLRRVFADLGYADPQTLIASANVLFGAAAMPNVAEIEQALETRFGFPVGVVVRPVAHLQKMVASDPFGAVDPEADVKLYVTFAAGPIGDRLADPGNDPADFELVRVDEAEWFAVAHRRRDGRYGATMTMLEKRFSDLTITSRNYNTVMRMLAKAGRTRQSSPPAKH